MKRFSFFPLFAALLLATFASGCITFTGGPNIEQERNDRRYDDAGIKTAIASALLKKDAAKANDINVHSFNGHVFLIGEADKEFRIEALEDARSAEGVVHVTTHWFPSGTASTAEDTAIETEIESLLQQTEGAESFRAAIDVWGGHVVLTGLSGKQEAIDSLLMKIKKIKQVKSVTSYIAIG